MREGRARREAKGESCNLDGSIERVAIIGRIMVFEFKLQRSRNNLHLKKVEEVCECGARLNG